MAVTENSFGMGLVKVLDYLRYKNCHSDLSMYVKDGVSAFNFDLMGITPFFR